MNALLPATLEYTPMTFVDYDGGRKSITLAWDRYPMVVSQLRWRNELLTQGRKVYNLAVPLKSGVCHFQMAEISGLNLELWIESPKHHMRIIWGKAPVVFRYNIPLSPDGHARLRTLLPEPSNEQLCWFVECVHTLLRFLKSEKVLLNDTDEFPVHGLAYKSI